MTLKDILKHPYFEQSKQIPIEINKKIKGRVCLTTYLHGLYLIKTLMKLDCPVYVEIGTLFGGSMITAMQCKYSTKFVGIDPFEGYYDKAVDPKSKIPVTVEIAKENIDSNNIHNHPYELVKGRSNNIKVVEYIKNKYNVIDLLFIDGDHSEQVVTEDFNNYSGLVRTDGIVIFDNYKDKNWKEVEIAVSKLNLTNWDIIGEFGNSIILSKK